MHFWLKSYLWFCRVWMKFVEVAIIILKFFKLLQNDPDTGRIFSQPPLITFKTVHIESDSSSSRTTRSTARTTACFVRLASWYYWEKSLTKISTKSSMKSLDHPPRQCRVVVNDITRTLIHLANVTFGSRIYICTHTAHLLCLAYTTT